MGASLLLGKVKPSGGPADPRGGALCVPPTALRCSRRLRTVPGNAGGGPSAAPTPVGMGGGDGGRSEGRIAAGARWGRWPSPTLAALRRLGVG